MKDIIITWQQSYSHVTQQQTIEAHCVNNTDLHLKYLSEPNCIIAKMEIEPRGNNLGKEVFLGSTAYQDFFRHTDYLKMQCDMHYAIARHIQAHNDLKPTEHSTQAQRDWTFRGEVYFACQPPIAPQLISTASIKGFLGREVYNTGDKTERMFHVYLSCDLVTDKHRLIMHIGSCDNKSVACELLRAAYR